MTKNSQSRSKKAGETQKVPPEAISQNRKNAPPVAMQDMLGEKLRAYYDEVARAPVPDRFEQLLKELEARSSSKKSN